MIDTDKLVVTSDHHFGHINILEFEKRPFRSVDGMDEAMIHRWNRVVDKDWTVVHLGDFSFHNKDKTIRIFNKLRGRKKILIMGNHDLGHSVSWWRNVGFDEVHEYPMVLEHKFILSHRPLEDVNLGSFVNVHGHIHSQKLSKVRSEDQYVNVSVDVTAYAPVLFRDISGGVE